MDTNDKYLKIEDYDFFENTFKNKKKKKKLQIKIIDLTKQ